MPYLQYLQLTLKILPSMLHNPITKRVEIYVYVFSKEHIVIPRKKSVYGSAIERIQVSDNTSYRHKFYVQKDKLKQINRDRVGHRCVNDNAYGDQESVGRCIVRYFEDVNNCSTYGLLSNNTKKICNKTSKYSMNIGWSEDEIFNLTGCIPNCTRDLISLKQDHDYPLSWPVENDQQKVIIMLEYEDGSYTLTEEYEDYDSSSFIADVGGYLGLLLGHSVLSIYYIVVDFMHKLKIKRLVVGFFRHL